MTTAKNMRGQLQLEDALTYMLAGNATFTIVNKVTQQRFTYRLRAPKYNNGAKQKVSETNFRFASLLNGADNENSYAYFAFLKMNDAGKLFTYHHGGLKARVGREAASVKVFELVLAHLRASLFAQLSDYEIYHEGVCGCCGRKLTVPESVAKGIGPVCEVETFKIHHHA